MMLKLSDEQRSHGQIVIEVLAALSTPQRRTPLSNTVRLNYITTKKYLQELESKGWVELDEISNKWKTTLAGKEYLRHVSR